MKTEMDFNEVNVKAFIDYMKLYWVDGVTTELIYSKELSAKDRKYLNSLGWSIEFKDTQGNYSYVETYVVKKSPKTP